jgi:DNA-binding CsgD family transcriptional regulator
MSAAVLKLLPAKDLRVSIRADDPEVAADARRLLEEAGYEVVEERGFAPVAEPEPRSLLTPRELEVLGAIGEGLTNKAIARRLDISLHTVKFHVESLFRKLGARTRTEALGRRAAPRACAKRLKSQLFPRKWHGTGVARRLAREEKEENERSAHAADVLLRSASPRGRHRGHLRPVAGPPAGRSAGHRPRWQAQRRWPGAGGALTSRNSKTKW